MSGTTLQPTEPIEPVVDPQTSPDGDTDGAAVGRRHLVWLALLALALAPFALIDGPARTTLERWGWVDRDERFTELYFPDHLALPDRATDGAPVPFDFSVHNGEGSPTTYRWQVSIAPAGSAEPSRPVASGEMGLDDDEVRVVHVEPVVDAVADAATVAPVAMVVTVTLVDRAETIHFPVAVEGDPGSP